MCVCAYVCLRVCPCVCVHLCVYVRMCVNMYVFSLNRLFIRVRLNACKSTLICMLNSMPTNSDSHFLSLTLHRYCASMMGLRLYRVSDFSSGAAAGEELIVRNRTARDVIVTQRSTKPRGVMSFEGSK